MKASGSPFGVKIDEKKDHHPIYHLGKMYDAMMFVKPVSIKDYKDSHQFSCKIQVLSTSCTRTYYGKNKNETRKFNPVPLFPGLMRGLREG